MFARSGGLRWLERRPDNRTALWLRSLFAIYDIDDMVALDVPWWTLSAIEKVERFLVRRPEARIFEYGSGASTIWLAKRARTVESVEHDESWAKIVRRRTSDVSGVRLHVIPPQSAGKGASAPSAKSGYEHLDFSEYVAAVSQVGGIFDLIVIDGRSRGACLSAALEHLAPDGVIVFDNSGRRRYQSAITNSGLDSLETRGLTVCLPYPDATTLLARDAATLRLLDD